MNGYSLAVYALAAALIAQVIAAGLSIECYLLPNQPRPRRRAWLALATASLLLALHHAYTLELALHTSLYDLRQAILAAAAGICLALAVCAFRRQV
jgi:hypothetical protein